MEDRTQHVIDSIDGALDDWSVSGDAMRWAPERQSAAAPAQRWVEVPGVRGVSVDLTIADEPLRGLAHDYSQTPRAELEERARQMLASGRTPGGLVVPGPGFRGGAIPSHLIVDDDGGLTPAWVAEQRRPMRASSTPSLHWAGLAIDPGGWAALRARLAEDAARRDRELEQQRAAFARAFEGVAETLRPVFDAVRQIAESMGTSMGELVRSLEALKAPAPLPPPIELRARDPRQYALELRQTRNTGPARPNAQNARRPRRHQ